MKLDDLSAAYNRLRNATLGRGVTPLVSSKLAERIGREYEAFRAWLADAGPLEDISASITARTWVTRYRELVAAVRAEGLALADDLEPLTSTPLEAAERALSKTGTALLWGAGAAAAVLLVLALARRS